MSNTQSETFIIETTKYSSIIRHYLNKTHHMNFIFHFYTLQNQFTRTPYTDINVCLII